MKRYPRYEIEKLQYTWVGDTLVPPDTKDICFTINKIITLIDPLLKRLKEERPKKKVRK